MSISEKQLAANRANSKKSTGPRTPRGKKVCTMNGFVHGLTGLATVMTDEDRETQIDFLKPIIEDLNPIGAMEIQLARGVALDQFRLNKIKTIEDNMLAWTELDPLEGKVNAQHPQVVHGLTQARAFFNNDRGFNNLSLYEQRITRNMHKNMKLLRELQAERKAEERLKQKAKPLTRSASGSGSGGERPGLRFGSLIPTELEAKTPVTAQNGFGFSSPLSEGEDATPTTPETPKGAEKRSGPIATETHSQPPDSRQAA